MAAHRRRFRPFQYSYYTMPLESFLYQAGYLTLRKGAGDDFKLDYPNAEVLESMSRLVSTNIIERNGDSYF